MAPRAPRRRSSSARSRSGSRGAWRVNAAMREPTLPSGEHDPDHPGGELELSHEVDEDDRERDVREEVGRAGATRLRAEVRVPEDEAKACFQLRPDARLFAFCRCGDGRLRLPDAKDEETRGDEADRVDKDRVWGCEELDEAAAHARAADLSRRAADLELRVALDDLLSLDERRDVRHVRDVEEDGAYPDEESDDEELRQRQDVGDVRDRDRREQCCAPEVAADEDRTPREPIDPHPGRQGEEDERQELDDAERGDLERGRVEHENRRERERELRSPASRTG